MVEAGAGASAALSQAGTKAGAGIGKTARSEMLAGEPGDPAQMQKNHRKQGKKYKKILAGVGLAPGTTMSRRRILVEGSAGAEAEAGVQTRVFACSSCPHFGKRR